LIPEAKRIFEMWFETFSEDGLMSPERCAEFIRNSTNDPNVHARDSRVGLLYE
jgi:hypothetical protein